MSKEEKIIDNEIINSRTISDSDLNQVSGGNPKTFGSGKKQSGGTQKFAATGNVTATTLASTIRKELMLTVNGE